MRNVVKKIFLLISILSILICTSSILFHNSKVYAVTGCPAGYTLSQCYDYLIKKRNELQAQRKKIESSLKGVQAQEGDIQAQVDQINAQISANENELAQKQVDVEIASIEIANVGEDISETKNRIDTLKQETQNSMQRINDLAMLSYKINSIPVWYLLAQNDLISTLEMIRYYDYLAQQEKVRLAQFKNLQSQLSAEEKSLATAQNTIITKRDKMESDNLEIIKLRSTLAGQRDRQKVLLANLAKQEKALAAQRATLIKQQNDADRQAVSIAIQLFESGKLPGGITIKRGMAFDVEGFTGCTFGAHLHYGFIVGTGSYRTNVNPFSAGFLHGSASYGSTVSSGKAQSPLSGGYVTQGFHDSYSLDMVTFNAGNQDRSKKYQIVNPVCWQTKWATYSLTGWGAPVFAAFDGKLYRGVDSMGGQYVIIDHGNIYNGKKLKSIYWHLGSSDKNKRLL